MAALELSPTVYLDGDRTARVISTSRPYDLLAQLQSPGGEAANFHHVVQCWGRPDGTSRRPPSMYIVHAHGSLGLVLPDPRSKHRNQLVAIRATGNGYTTVINHLEQTTARLVDQTKRVVAGITVNELALTIAGQKANILGRAALYDLVSFVDSLNTTRETSHPLPDSYISRTLFKGLPKGLKVATFAVDGSHQSDRTFVTAAKKYVGWHDAY